MTLSRRSASLIFNPKAGSGAASRRAAVEQVASRLRERGLDCSVFETSDRGSAGRCAVEALGAGAEIVFACGGDGTVHEVMQALTWQGGEPAQTAALGVVPMGSANALARHLGLSLDPVEAAMMQLDFTPQVVPVGRITCAGQPPLYGRGRLQDAHQEALSRTFAVMAGAGPNGSLVYRMLAGEKRTLGRSAYYLRAARLFARRSFPAFTVRYRASETGVESTVRAVSAMAVRVSDLGGIFSPLVRGGDLTSTSLRLVMARPPARISLPLWFGLSWTGMQQINPLLTTVDVTDFRCTPDAGQRLDAQADGEWLGRGPVEVSLGTDFVRLLMRT